ncbi:MAG: T9SS type A sorting domain-containing protein [Bacteroidota bacterium]
MNRIASRLTMVAGWVVLLGAVLHAQPVDAGIFQASTSALEIRLRPSATITGLPFSNVVFTIRWLDSYGVNLGSPYSATYSVSKQGIEQVSGLYRYQKFAAATAQTVTWPAGVELSAMTVPVIQTGSGVGSFELVNDVWTGANNSSYYIEISGNDNTGSIYQASVDGIPLPLAVTALHASAQDGYVLLRWKAEGVAEGIGFVVERRAEHGDWISVGMVMTDESDADGGYSFADPISSVSHAAAAFGYRLNMLDADGSSRYSPEVQVRLDEPFTGEMQCQVYPSPANGAIGVSLSIPADDVISLHIVDILGRRMQMLADHETVSAGLHARSYAVRGLPYGGYFIVMTGRTRTISVPIVLKAN